MASEFCLSITKYFLFLFNLICFFLGLSLLGLGLWIICSESSFTVLMPNLPYLPLSLFSYLLIISGSVTVLLGFFGSLGALKELKCMLAIYFILLTVFLAAQIIGSVLLFTQKSAFQSSLGSHVTESIKSSGKNNTGLQHFQLETLENVQREANCCGWTGKNDWDTLPCSCYYINGTVNATNASSPNSCHCETSNYTCGVYEKGCSKVVKHWFDKNLLTILGVVLAIAVVEICGIILSMCLYSHVSLDNSMDFL